MYILIHPPLHQSQTVIFLDEPTTGLDSQISLEVMSAVRNIANHNRTVVCTIHSPSEGVYALFDSLLLLALGRQTYFGATQDAPRFFGERVLGWAMPGGKNPADFIMEANQGLLTTADGTRRTIREINKAFLDSPNYAAIEGVIERAVGGAKDEEAGNGGAERRTKGTRRIRSESVVAKMVRPEKYPRSLPSLMYILSVRQLRKVLKSRDENAIMILRNVRPLPLSLSWFAWVGSFLNGGWEEAGPLSVSHTQRNP